MGHKRNLSKTFISPPFKILEWYKGKKSLIVEVNFKSYQQFKTSAVWKVSDELSNMQRKIKSI